MIGWENSRQKAVLTTQMNNRCGGRRLRSSDKTEEKHSQANYTKIKWEVSNHAVAKNCHFSLSSEHSVYYVQSAVRVYILLQQYE